MQMHRTVRPCSKAAACGTTVTASLVHPAASRHATPFVCSGAGLASPSSSAPSCAPMWCVPTALLQPACQRRSARQRIIAQAGESTSTPLPKAVPGQTPLAFLGIGIMGLAMTNRLLQAGYEVHVWNRNPDKCAPLVAAGAKLAASPAAAVRAATYSFAMLSDPQAALQVATGKDGVVQGLSAGKGYVDVSTVDADTSRAIGAAVAAAGGAFLEAPVSGSKGPAEQGTLIFLAAGDEALFTAVEAPLAVMGKASLFLGPTGAGAHMKLVVNMIMGSMMASFAEGLVLAKKAGLRQEDVVSVAGLGAINAPMFQLKGPLMAKGAFAPAFPLKHQQKDMRLALLLGEELATALPVAAAANARYLEARGQGLGDLDFSAVYKTVAADQEQ